ncbi:hypothetical protein CQA62_00495 [Helicobacter cholecystus]|uniref:Outer membrane protein n=1 Tax=Helicobacter cholecystus TaxID=45498 RepID=A0A3D8IXD2_9HELI|nr:outer membrane beta-barrel protein [Helicobacter cholecystus]RDU69927.1 hypothetical protein CQA62_00495 [Helicobacter cholecystus]
MKRKILSIAIASIAYASMAEARFFIGVDAGYTTAISEPKGRSVGNENIRFLTVNPNSWASAFRSKSRSDGQDTYTKKPYLGFNLGLNFGSEHFFLDDYLGIRVGGLIGYTNYKNITTKTNTSNSSLWKSSDKFREGCQFLDTGVNLDLMVNFWSNGAYSFGVFGGVEANYHYLLSYFNTMTEEKTRDVPTRHLLDFSGRVGISTLLEEHHRLDILAKLPIGSVVSETETKTYLIAILPTISINVGYKYIF